MAERRLPHLARRRAVPLMVVLSVVAITLVPDGALATGRGVDTMRVGELDPASVERPGRIADSFDADRPHDVRSILVRLKPGFTGEQVFSENHQALFDDWWKIEMRPDQAPAVAAEAMARRPGIDLVDLNYQIQAIEPEEHMLVAPSDSLTLAAAPNDPYFGLQWNFGPIQLPLAWKRTTGTGSVVAVLDTGIVPANQTMDLACHNYVSEYNAHTNTSGAGSASDTDGHGTHVSGTVAQCTNNNLGVAGVAPDARIMPIDVFNTDTPPSASGEALARGIVWAADRGVEVINLSLGVTCPAPCGWPVVTDAIAYAAVRDVVIVAASGNDNSSTLSNFPANHPDVIAVGATEFRNHRAYYSAYGDGIDLVAPGGDITVDRNSDGYPDGILQETLSSGCSSSTPPLTVYCFWQGTSMATPHVAGAVALMRAANPSASRNQVRDALRQTAKDLGPVGYDPENGHGLLQVDNAILYVESIGPDSAPPIWPAGAAVTQVARSGSSVSVDWPDATDNVGVAGYRVSLDGEVLGTVVGSATTISGLEAATEYQFSVRARDQAGNLSTALTAKVATGGDNEPPTWSPGSFVDAVDVFENRALVHWSPTATDFSGLSSFLVYAGPLDPSGSMLASLVAEVAPDVNRVELVGLLAGTDYGVRIEARDTAGNGSQDGPVTTLQTAPDFVDTDSHLFEEDIEWLAGAKVTRGCNPPVNDRFCPDDPVTRGQMAAFLVRALGLPATAEDYFDDIAQSVFEADINALAAAAVTRGCNPPANDLYCPGQAVTREQMASFLVRALQLEATEAETFVDIEGSVHATDIETLASSGITRGCNPPVNDRFCPNDTVTRGQMAAFLRRALGGT
ncbi:hypothetical protein BH23ACT5_BH23ACT5_24700 [soil metagenome]